MSTMFKTIHLDAPNISELEKRYVTRALDQGFVSTFGPYVPEFEEKFCHYIGAQATVAVQSGTAAMHMALHELGVGPEDEVIVPVLTFIATVNPIQYLGAQPVFVDVDTKTWTMDINQIKLKINKKTKGIIVVHLYGHSCNMDAVMELARKQGLFVIEDATQSLGSYFQRRHTGTMGDFGVFSFNGNKTITVGGGGMLAGQNKKSIDHIRFLVNQARSDQNGYFHPEIGFNYRMTNLEASLGLAQLERVDDFLATKKRFSEIYRKELSDIAGLHFQDSFPQSKDMSWLTNIFLKKRKMEDLQKGLMKRGVPTRRVFMPLTEFPMYQEQGAKKAFLQAYAIYESGLTLPGSTLNVPEDILQVCRVIKEELNREA